jgi:octaprenyl-diphosphate synthase
MKAMEHNPLENLYYLLAGEMEQVNALIIDRLSSDVDMIPKVARHLIASGGKRIRPLLTLASARMYGDESDRPFRLAAAVEFIHSATLLHDDVVDESLERRGQASANVMFGNQASILVGDFLFSRSFQLMVEDGSLEVLRILSDASAIITQGEVMQLTTAGNLDTTFEEYEKVIKSKTAALFAAACEIGPVIAGEGVEAAEAMCGFGINLGIAFQIADDILDYSSSREKIGKTVGDDFREGKMTAPLILAVSKADPKERDFWKRTMVDLDQTEDDLARAQEILTRHGCYQSGMAIAGRYAEQALQNLEQAPAGELREALSAVARFTVDREY